MWLYPLVVGGSLGCVVLVVDEVELELKFGALIVDADAVLEALSLRCCVAVTVE